MIGKTIKGRGFRGLLDYLAGRQGAELIGGNMEGTNPRELAREFAFSRAMRPTLGKAVCHIPLRLPYDEHLSEQQWRRIAERVMAGMGFADCSYALYLHPQDPQGEHLHIVASRVTFLGDAVADSNDIYRLMQIERRIEKDYGLREVPFARTAARRPGRGEMKLRARTGQVPERQQLQAVVAGAARPGLPVAELVAALERQGVELRPAISSTGRVSGMRYRRGEYTFSGSSLGADFTWPGLLGRLGLAFDPARDLPALVAAGRRFDALEAVIAGSAAGAPAAARAALAAASDDTASGPEPMELEPMETTMPDERTMQADPASRGDAAAAEVLSFAARAAGPAGAGGGGEPGVGGDAPRSSRPAAAKGAAPPSSPPAATGGARHDTADQVARQLAALGSPRYDLLILDAASGEHRHLRTGLTPAGVVADIPWLKHLNAGGCEILVRPSAAASLTHFEGVRLPALQAAGAAGFEAAAVLRAPDGAREVWMRGGADLPPTVQELVDRELARQLRPDRPPQAPGYGHLAGFTSPLAQRAGGLARPPFLTLEEDRGRVYSGFRELAAETRARAAAQVIEVRAEREIAGLGRPAAARAAAAPTDARPADAAQTDATPADASPRRAAASRPASPQAALHQLLAITDQEAERRGLAGPARLPDAKDVEQELARWTAARKAHADALAAAGAGGERADEAARGAAPYRRKARVVATFREQEAARHALAERLGVREVPDDLPAGAALTLARWQASLADAEERLDRLLVEPGATAGERLEGAVAVRTLRDELADAAREHGLTLREPAPGVASVLLADQDEAAGGAGAAAAGEPTAGAPGAATAPTPVGEAAGALRPGQEAPGIAAPPAAPAIATPDDEVLVGAYDDAAIPNSAVRHAAGWREQLAAELTLEQREAALGAQLRVLERAHERASLQLDGLEARIERRPTSETRAAHDTLVATVLELEARQVPLAERIAHLANHRVGRDSSRLERILERQPTAPALAELTRLLDERRELAPRLAAASRRHVEFELVDETAKPLVKPARDRFDRAVKGLLERPSPGAVRGVKDAHAGLRAAEDLAGRVAAAAELSAARHELYRAGDALLGAAAEQPGEPPSPAHVGSLRRALDRYQAAETAVARRLEAAATAADATSGDVETLLLHVRRGDSSPGTLARLQRAIGRELRALGVSVGPLPAAPAASSLAEAIGEWKTGSAALRAAGETFFDGHLRGADPVSLVRLRHGVAGYQSAAAELDRHTQAAARTPESRALGPRYFLDHAAFAGQPHRAVAAWSAHAAERGVDPKRIPERLARSGGARMASPRLLSVHYGYFLASAVTRVGLAVLRHFANEP